MQLYIVLNQSRYNTVVRISMCLYGCSNTGLIRYTKD